MPTDVYANDLTYYATVTDPNGPAMTWQMFLIGWLALNQTQQVPRRIA
jgi:hypothetical protein